MTTMATQLNMWISFFQIVDTKILMVNGELTLRLGYERSTRGLWGGEEAEDPLVNLRREG